MRRALLFVSKSARRIIQPQSISRNVSNLLKQPCLVGANISQTAFLNRGICPLSAPLSTMAKAEHESLPKSALVLLAEGAEEAETVITIDVLRCSDIKVVVAGLAGDDVVKCKNGTLLKPDKALAEILASSGEESHFDAVVLPGGPAAKALSGSADVGKLLQSQDAAGGLIGAICSGPTALKSHAIGHGKVVTSHESAKADLQGEYKYSDERVVQDSNLVTSQAPGTAFEFALKLVENLRGKEKMEDTKFRFKCRDDRNKLDLWHNVDNVAV